MSVYKIHMTQTDHDISHTDDEIRINLFDNSVHL